MHFTLVQNGSAIITSEQNFPNISLCVFPGLFPQLAHSASLISSAWSAPSANASWANSLTMIADKTPVDQRCNNLLARPDWGFVTFSKACCVFSKTEGLEVFFPSRFHFHLPSSQPFGHGFSKPWARWLYTLSKSCRYGRLDYTLKPPLQTKAYTPDLHPPPCLFLFYMASHIREHCKYL